MCLNGGEQNYLVCIFLKVRNNTVVIIRLQFYSRCLNWSAKRSNIVLSLNKWVWIDWNCNMPLYRSSFCCINRLNPQQELSNSATATVQSTILQTFFLHFFILRRTAINHNHFKNTQYINLSKRRYQEHMAAEHTTFLPCSAHQFL